MRVAARLHDSVLQTLALVQRADDAATARAQARRQERELRSWLYDEESQDGPDTLASAMSAIATDVETGYGVVVELVQHRDAPFDPALSALADAARETIVNAAKHSGAETVSVFVQLAEREAVIFVRDEGRGFDPAIVPTDRHGLRDSVVRRLAEHDGTARVTTTEGQGTEVELHVPRMSST
jgi:signal transduction histidine kinase